MSHVQGEGVTITVLNAENTNVSYVPESINRAGRSFNVKIHEKS